MAGQGRLTRLASQAADLVPPGPVVVALSGGADSAVLAWALVTAGRPVRAVHVNHGLSDSGAMEVAAKAVAAMLGLDLAVVHVEVPPGPSPEAQARFVRREALAANASPEEWIATGHQQDDVAETILDRLARGSGAAGLASVRPRRGRWVRPLLDVSRADLRRFAADLELPYTDDPANADLDALRNRIRSAVLPTLEAATGSGVGRRLARSAGLIAADDETLEAAAGSIPLRRRGSEVLVASAELVTAPQPVATRAVRAALAMVHDGLFGSHREVVDVLAVARGDAPRHDLSGGWSVVREGPWVAFTTEPIPGAPQPVSLSVPGEVDFGGHVLIASIGRVPLVGRNRIALDPGVAGAGLVVRTAVPGERIDFEGGTKKVTDALAECGIPARLRPGWPVLAARGNIAWIAGCRPAPWAVAAGDGEEEPVVVTLRRRRWSR